MRRLRCSVADERGVVGGAEILPFGFLVFVVGTLLLVNVWAVIDAKLATSAAAREAVRAYVESAGPDQALGDAERAATLAFDGHRVRTDSLVVTAVGGTAFVRCATATFEVTSQVPTIQLPWIGGLGGSTIEVASRHSEIVDPYRSGEFLGATDEAVPC